ncbi:kinesin-like protein KIF14 isoform X3 [Thrips palmi]|nr:kinesin-like protein KIF14 isoform X3 [Thrips palmi]XP_034236614.1 kinesin-like protein KIF14 isoform X3 [Thrips palmi]XP_034236615.1 kinesin-like protein KIF14 isoform X3 [Thrips palmi]
MPERIATCSGGMPLPGESPTPQQRRAPNISSLFRSQSINSLRPTEVEESRRDSSKIASSRKLSSDRTPVTHFCTPKRRSSNQSMVVSRNSMGTARRGLDSSHLNSRASTPLAVPLQRHRSEASLLPPPSTPNGKSHNGVPMATPECYSRVRLETPTPRRRLANDTSGMCEESSNLTVGVRVRPLSQREQNDNAVSNVVYVGGNEIQVTCDTGAGTTHRFTYDHCFASGDPDLPNYASQETIFSAMVLPLIDKSFQGYNACLFAYGQTGSGKSYSMMGLDTDCKNGSMGQDAGIIPRFCHEVFQRIKSLDDSRVTTRAEISYFEIYNEKIHDLLGGATVGAVGNNAGADASVRRPPLKVREHPQDGPYVVDLSVHGVESYSDIQSWLTVGNSQRATAATGMNEKSSRSHSIFSVILTQTHPHGDVELSRRSKINLVDLAGSERCSQTCASGDRLREGVSINRSLLTLGKVIAALAENAAGRRKGYVPYRDSVLTWLLRESLGGNSSTTMLATVSPCSSHLEETLATLRYACQARTIVNMVRVNEDPSHRRIRQLLAEIATLREVHEDLERQQRLSNPGRRTQSPAAGLGAQGTPQDPAAVQELREKLRQTEEQLAMAQKSWSERLREAERCKNAEVNLLRRRGVALALDGRQLSEQPCPFLVNLTPDPSLSGALLYLLPPGPVRVGRVDSSQGAASPCTPGRSPMPGAASTPSGLGGLGLNGSVGASPVLGRSPTKTPGRSPPLAPHIQLEGPLVQRHHCTIENRQGRLTLEPGREGLTFVNGRAVTGRTMLHNGDRLVLGGNHYFRVSNPHDKSNPAEPPADYEFAHKEILAVQEAKLKAELEDAKYKAMKELEEAKREAEARLMIQRSDYEKQLQQLGQTLEQHKDALFNERKEKHQLEVQKTALEAEMNRQLSSTRPASPPAVEVTLHRSRFIEELEALLNTSMNALENDTNCTSPGTSMSFNDRYPYSSTSLHEMQMQVREASQRCKELGIPYDFQQQHVVRESGLEPVIRVRDHSQKMSVLWTPATFGAWLDRLRDWDPEDSVAALISGFEDGSEEVWEADESEVTADEVDGNITVNTLPIRRKMNESLQQSLVESPLESRKSPGFESTEAQQYLKDIEKATKQLKNLLSRGTGSRTPLKCVNNLEEAVTQLKNSLKRETSLFSKSPNGISTPQSSKSVRFFDGLVKS